MKHALLSFIKDSSFYVIKKTKVSNNMRQLFEISVIDFGYQII